MGPGSGVYLPTLTSLYREVTPTGIEAQYLRHLAPLVKQHTNLRLIEDDVTVSRPPTASFDVILWTEVLETVSTSHRAL